HPKTGKMKSSTARKLARQPTRDDLLGRARELAAFAKKNAQETEQNRRVSAEFISMMKRAELFRILQPKAFGGFEYDFKLFVDAASTIAAGCPSSGWVGSI